MSVVVSQITDNTTVYSTAISGKKNTQQISTLLALCEGSPIVSNGFPSQRASNVEKFKKDVINWHFWDEHVMPNSSTYGV